MSARIFLIGSLCLLLSVTSIGQEISEFPTEPEEFIKTLTDFMTASRKEGKKFVDKEFGPFYISGLLTMDQQTLILETCNMLLDKKHPAYPVFEQYLLAMMVFPNSGKTAQEFNEWHTVLYKILDDKRKKKFVEDFMKNSATIFENGVFFSANAVQWKFSNSNYKFVFDSIPAIEFPEGNLICYTKGDSTRIMRTGGVFFPTLDRWIGEKGRVTWDRADFDPELTYAEFGAYEVRIKGSTYTVDSVLFYNEYFEKPLLGQLTEKVIADRTGDKASYPRFESYNQRLQIKNIFENVDYDGGFTMRGNKLAGTGTNEEPAKLVFYRENAPFLEANSLEFAIRPDRLTSQQTQVSIFLDKDSITHPELNLKFDRKTRKLVLLRTDEGVSKSPYYNSYHDVDMFFEALYWNIDDPLIEMGSIIGSTQHMAAFESKDYYNDKRYDSMMGLANTHPLVEIRDYTRQSNSIAFYDYQFAGFLRLSKEQTSLLLIDLNNQGFVEYDMMSGFCVVKEKLFEYLRNNSGIRDYDVLLFNSEIDNGNNAQLNLLNYNLLLKGIRRIQLSDSQNVNIYPAREEVILKKNRDFKCGGRIRAGNLELLGKEYEFKYEEFQIDLLQVDSCRIYVQDIDAQEDAFGNKNTVQVKNVIEDMTGTLKIDAPTNKSGVHSKDYSEYPILTSKKDSYVYYDNSRIQKGVYGRDKFYYQVEPFVIDSLDNFNSNDLSFQGTLVSSGIFPDIDEPLVLMDDYSLGFDVATTTSGLPIYGGKGDFTADVRLSYNGLQGSGSLDFLTSTSMSEEFTFFPDSTLGKTKSFLNNEQAGSLNVPKVTAQVVDLAFYPKSDRLKATSLYEPITFFRNEAELTGSLNLTPKGMTGKGDMDFEGATVSSLKFDYTPRNILADTSAFQLAQSALESLAFKTDNVSADVDFDQRVGEFKSLGGETIIEFPSNQYICYMDEFKWFMDKGEMELASNRKASQDFVIDTDASSNASNFYSVNELQDSLNFLAPKAVYDIASSVITCNEIPYITVADTRILPDSGKVIIQKRAKIDPLQRAVLISNYVTQYHRIFNSNVQINGRLDFEGEGDMAYVDENKLEQIIHLDKIAVDSSLQTTANGKITEDDSFTLNPFFSFYGDFELRANQKNLTFDGGAQIMHTCESLERNWFKFRSEIDPLDIYIPVDTNMRDVKMSKLGVGVMVSSDSPLELYGSFLSRKNDRSDEGLIEALGFLTYDKGSKSYKVGSKEKIKQPKLPGNLLSLDTESCEITGDGEIDYQVDYGHVKFQSVGDIRHNGMNGKTTVNGVLSLDFFFDESLMKRLSDQLSEWPELLPIDIAKTDYEKGIKQIMGLEASDKVISELNLSGQFKRIPTELQKTFFFADITFKWDDVEETFVSEGPIGIATIGKKQIFRYVKGKVELAKSRSADILRVYLELDPGNWYYFEYKLGIMNITSTDKEFVTAITELKEDKTKTKDDEGNKFAYQVVASRKKRDDFVDRFDEFD
jgi:hypothetical protein